MRIVLIHSDFIEYEAREPVGDWAEKLGERKSRIEEALVVFTAAEKVDEKDPDLIVSNVSDEISKIAEQLNTGKIVLYPYAHLSSSLASPEEGRKLLEATEREMQERGFDVDRAPFGWYKSFIISCKGHPLSEISREIKPEKKTEKALEAEKKLISHWYIATTNGGLNEIGFEGKKLTGFDFQNLENLEKFAKYELAKERKAKEESPHIKLMKQLELADYEPASDPGNMRFLPRGRIMKGLLERFVTDEMLKNGALEVETPLMYDIHHPALESYLSRFPARQYRVKSPNKDLFMRFSACFGQFLIAKDANLSYKNLPLWMFELAESFRVEQRGELTGLRRLRSFTMPDCHAFCADLDQAKGELLRRLDLAMDMQERIGFDIPEDLELAIRITKDFWNDNEEIVFSLIERWGKPALIEIWDEQFFYFVLKYELNFVDCLDKASALTTDQIDVENAGRYGIKFENSNGGREEPLILHLSPTGAIERVMYTLLERSWMRYKKLGEKPSIPLWLAPVQMRLIPVSQGEVDDCLELRRNLGGRVDVDDRDESVAKRIRDAEREWINMIVVYGERERENSRLMVRFRSGVTEEMSVEGVNRYILKKTEGYPYLPLGTPMILSRRPRFGGG